MTSKRPNAFLKVSMQLSVVYDVGTCKDEDIKAILIGA